MTLNDFSAALYSRTSSSRMRWRKTDAPVLVGEARALAGAHGVSWLSSSLPAIVELARTCADKPNRFKLGDGQYGFEAGLGQLARRRYMNGTDSDGKVTLMLRLWSRSTVEQFVEQLRRLVQTADGQPLDFAALVRVIANWDRNRDDIITAVATEYHTRGKKPEGEES